MNRDQKHLVKDAFEHFKALIILETAASQGESVVVEFLKDQEVRVRIGEVLGTGNNFLEAFTQAHSKWEEVEVKAA